MKCGEANSSNPRRGVWSSVAEKCSEVQVKTSRKGRPRGETREIE